MKGRVDSERLAAAPVLNQELLRGLVAGEVAEDLFQVPDLPGFDNELLAAFQHVYHERGITLETRIPSRSTPERFSALKVKGGLKDAPTGAHLLVQRGFDPSTLGESLRDRVIGTFAYDLGAAVHPRYPGMAGVSRENGLPVRFPLVSYAAPHPLRPQQHALGTRLRDEKGLAQAALDTAHLRSWADSAGRWEGTIHVVSAGGFGVGSKRR